MDTIFRYSKNKKSGHTLVRCDEDFMTHSPQIKMIPYDNGPVYSTGPLPLPTHCCVLLSSPGADPLQSLHICFLDNDLD